MGFGPQDKLDNAGSIHNRLRCSVDDDPANFDNMIFYYHASFQDTLSSVEKPTHCCISLPVMVLLVMLNRIIFFCTPLPHFAALIIS